MNRTIHYEIKESGSTIRQFLRRKGYSAHNLSRLKRTEGGVLVNGSPRFFNQALHQGDLLTVQISENDISETILPVELPLEILYEDEDLLVVNKAAGMPIHTSMDNHANSLANALAWYFREQGKPFVFRCCNRLDRDTSGLTIVAKHSVSSGILSEMGSRREIRREYLAIVKGQPSPPSGVITAPLGRKPGSIIERTVDFENGEPAVTHYQVLQSIGDHSLVCLKLETGRTHQIRIHMKHLGYPLIGDYLYNPDFSCIQRQALHSWRMSFRHPITGETLSFTAPLPKDMGDVLRRRP